MTTNMNKTVRMIGYIVCASLALALAGGIGILKPVQSFQSPAPTGLADTVVPLAPPPYDASKPTVVLVLGNSLTEATNFLGPYAMFAASGSPMAPERTRSITSSRPSGTAWAGSKPRAAAIFSKPTR